MWVATTADEANFIFDLQADRKSNAPVLVYADWLEAQGEQLPAEFLRRFLSANENEDRLQALRSQLDPRWLAEVTRRWFRIGDRVQVLQGYWQGFECTVLEVDAREARADVCPLGVFCRRTGPTWVSFADLIMLRFAEQAPDGSPCR